MIDKLVFSWADVFARCGALAKDLNRRTGQQPIVYGVPRGGAIVSALLTKFDCYLVDDPVDANIIVDDIIDSGATRDRYIKKYPGAEFFGLVDKQQGDRGMGWVVFPWEERDETADVEDNVVRLLEFIGEDPNREGLKDTPKRFVKALVELTSGVGQDAAAPLATVFDEDHDEIVCVKDMPFSSLCEHHLLGFSGTVSFAYLPQGKLVGLSKIPRMIGILASRPQVQERLTSQIADTFNETVKPLGVMAVVRGHHSCMSCRGVRSQGEMVTSVVRGVFKDKPEARAEALALMGIR